MLPLSCTAPPVPRAREQLIRRAKVIQYLESALHRHLRLAAQRAGDAAEGQLTQWLATLESGCSFDCVVKLLFDYAPGEGRITMAPPTNAERRLLMLAPPQPAWRSGGQEGDSVGAERVEIIADIATRVECKVKTLE